MEIKAIEKFPELTTSTTPISLEGVGTISCKGISFDVSLLILLIPGNSLIIECFSNDEKYKLIGNQFLQSDDFSIIGTAGGRQFKCDQMFCSYYSFVIMDKYEWKGIFDPRSELIFYDSDNDIEQYTTLLSIGLITYQNYSLNVDLDNLKFQIITPPSLEDLRKYIKIWKTPIESSMLTVTADPPVPIEILLEKTDQFLLLLSVLEGEIISYCRKEIIDTNGNITENWMANRLAWTPNRIWRILPVQRRDFAEYLQKSYESYSSLKSDRSKLLKLAISYHLAAKNTIIMNRSLIFEAIMWEMMIAYHNECDEGLSPDIKDLKQNIKSLIKGWRKQHPDLDPNGMYSDRISKAFEWKTLREGITQLTETLLKECNLPIDPISIKELRDALIHSGSFPDDFPINSDNARKLDKLTYIGDLIILKTLCFDIQPIDYEDWTPFAPE